MTYPWPSTVNVANFVSIKPLLGDDKERNKNFKLWKDQMLCLLEGQGLLGFIDGEILPLSSDEKLWRRTDRLIKGWILGSIGDDALSALADKLNITDSSSREILLGLENIFNEMKDGDGDISEDGSQPETPVSTNDLDRTNSMSKKSSLHKAASTNDWLEAMRILGENKQEIAMVINSEMETMLHVAVSAGRSNDFVRKLLAVMPLDTLLLRDCNGLTALHDASFIGNTEAAMMLVTQNPDLLYILDDNDTLPVHQAVISCQKSTLIYLISAHEKDLKAREEIMKNNPFEGNAGIRLLIFAICSEFADIALNLVEKYPRLASLKDEDGDYALNIIAERNFLFLSGSSFNWWQKMIYSCITVTSSSKSSGDIENQIYYEETERVTDPTETTFSCRVPLIKTIRDKKLMHQQSLELVKCLCKGLETLPEEEATDVYRNSILRAANKGIHEVVEMIIEIFPGAIYTYGMEDKCNIFLIAAKQRFENVFNKIYNLDYEKYFFYDSKDSTNNGFMHMCAMLAPPHKLNLISGAALQMQRELQWFQEMENFVNPSRRSWPNDDGYTAKMLFTTEHKKLKAEGEKWLKDAANSCTFAAALIATVVYAAAFQVPGGLEANTGTAVLWKEVPFILFIIADTISLFTSLTSLLMFLAILTSRYAEEDFLHVLPKRLCIGLLTLFISIIFMMIAFGATLYLVFWKKSGWILLPMAALACLPVTSFVLLQFPLLADVMYSTYGPGIFAKKK